MAGDSPRVVTSTGHHLDALAVQAPNQAGHIPVICGLILAQAWHIPTFRLRFHPLPSIIAMTQPSVVAPPPCKGEM
jgi:hypothetical protein